MSKRQKPKKVITTTTITIPAPIAWSREDLELLDPKVAGRVGELMTFCTMLSAFLFRYRGPMDMIQACQRFKVAVAGAAPDESVDVLAADLAAVKALVGQQQFIHDVGVKLIPHIEAITGAG